MTAPAQPVGEPARETLGPKNVRKYGEEADGEPSDEEPYQDGFHSLASLGVLLSVLDQLVGGILGCGTWGMGGGPWCDANDEAPMASLHRAAELGVECRCVRIMRLMNISARSSRTRAFCNPISVAADV